MLPRSLRLPVVLLALAALTTGCSSADPTPTTAVRSAAATQTEGPLGEGTSGVERSDAAALAGVRDVLATEETPREDIECAWSTRTVLVVTFADGTTTTLEADSCGATGRDAAVGALVAGWVADDA